MTWVDHRRSRTLAPEFGAEYVCMESGAPYALRVLNLGMATLVRLLRMRPEVLFVQNPSLASTGLCCLLKPLLGYRLVVDRHSNFKLETLGDRSVKMMLFHAVSRWTVGKADLTIVTNTNLRDLVVRWGGRAAVLPDRLPPMETARSWTDAVRSPLVAVFVAGYESDEPLDEVLKAARATRDLCHFYVTGNYRKAGIVPPADAPNVTFTGFLPDPDYVALLARADIVIVLTSDEDLLNCGSYEAIALDKPLVLSDTKAIREYFRKGALYVRNDAEGIVRALREFHLRPAALRAEVRELKQILRVEWAGQFEAVRRLAGLEGASAPEIPGPR